ncbi:MAG: DJ-1/PfpI family protein, partial [Alphaproteobacteria bacterium]
MSEKPLDGKRVAILVADGFEQVELTEPRKALDAAGADTSIVSLKPGRVRAWKFTEWGDEFPVDMAAERSDPAAFDALLLPGGVINPDTLRMNKAAMSFVR